MLHYSQPICKGYSYYNVVDNLGKVSYRHVYPWSILKLPFATPFLAIIFG